MEILYIWIENYKNIKGQAFVFNNNYTFYLDTSKNKFELNIKNDRLYKIAKKPFSNINAIVGINGSGKSTLIDFIKNVLCLNECYLNKAIVCFKKSQSLNSDIHVLPINYDHLDINSIRLNHKLVSQDEGFPVFKTDSYYSQQSIVKGDASYFTKSSLLSDTEFIFYSNIFDYRYEDDSSFMRNISTNFLLPEAKTTSNYRMEEIRRQMNFYFSEIMSGVAANNEEDLFKNLGLRIPEEITITYTTVKKIYYQQHFDKTNSYFSNLYDYSNKIKLEAELPSDASERTKNQLQINSNKYSSICHHLVFKVLVDISKQVKLYRLNDMLEAICLCLGIEEAKYNVESFKTEFKVSDLIYRDVNKEIYINLMMKEINRGVEKSDDEMRDMLAKLYEESKSERTIDIYKFYLTQKHVKQNHEGIIDLIDSYISKTIDDLHMKEKISKELYTIKQLIISFSSIITTTHSKNNIITVPLIKNEHAIRNIISSCNELEEINRFFKFEWRDMSSGEKSIFSLLARFYSISPRNHLNDKYRSLQDYRVLRRESNFNNVVILIDEGEVFFHPEWQRMYMKLLVDFLPIIFSTKKRRIQLIISTHSPLLLSDLPKSNIVFIDKNEQGLCNVRKSEDMKETFAGNISRVYSDSFFLKQNLIGEFAKALIKSELKEFANYDGSSAILNTQYRKFINIIGEPVIHRKLMMDLEEKIEWADIKAESHD